MEIYNPTHPGEILKTMYFEPLSLTVTEAAKALGVTRQALSDLVNGHSGISVDMAMRLAIAFETSPEFWHKLQSQYDLWHVKRKDFSHVRKLINKNKLKD